MSGLIEDNQILIYASAFNLLQRVVLVEVHEENSSFTQIWSQKREKHLNNLFGELWIFFGVTPKLDKRLFIKG